MGKSLVQMYNDLLFEIEPDETNAVKDELNALATYSKENELTGENLNELKKAEAGIRTWATGIEEDDSKENRKKSIFGILDQMAIRFKTYGKNLADGKCPRREIDSAILNYDPNGENEYDSPNEEKAAKPYIANEKESEEELKAERENALKDKAGKVDKEKVTEAEKKPGDIDSETVTMIDLHKNLSRNIADLSAANLDNLNIFSLISDWKCIPRFEKADEINEIQLELWDKRIKEFEVNFIKARETANEFDDKTKSASNKEKFDLISEDLNEVKKRLEIYNAAIKAGKDPLEIEKKIKERLEKRQEKAKTDAEIEKKNNPKHIFKEQRKALKQLEIDMAASNDKIFTKQSKEFDVLRRSVAALNRNIKYGVTSKNQAKVSVLMEAVRVAQEEYAAHCIRVRKDPNNETRNNRIKLSDHVGECIKALCGLNNFKEIMPKAKAHTEKYCSTVITNADGSKENKVYAKNILEKIGEYEYPKNLQILDSIFKEQKQPKDKGLSI